MAGESSASGADQNSYNKNVRPAALAERHRQTIAEIEKLQEDVYELDLYLNSFFMSYYLKKDEKEKVWEDYTNILRTKRDIKISNNPLDQLKSDLGKLDINLNLLYLVDQIILNF